MSVILWTIIVVSYVVLVTVIGSYFGICCLKLRKRVKGLQEDAFRFIEQMTELKERCIELSDTEKKLMFIALTLPELKKEIQAQGLDDLCEYLKKKIKDSIKD